MNVRYRDLGYLVPFGIQVLMYLSPVIYPLSIAPNYRHILELNPLSIFLELHRAIILQTSLPSLTQIFVAFGLSLAVFFLGSIYFRSVERQFADII